MGWKNAHARGQIWLSLAPNVGRPRRARSALGQLLDHERQWPKEGTQAALGGCFPWLALDERRKRTDDGGPTGVVWQVGYGAADLANAWERADVAYRVGRDHAACRGVRDCTEWAERPSTGWTGRGKEKGQEADVVYCFRERQVVR